MLYMNNATTTTATEKKTIDTLIAELNAKATAAGCEVRAEYMTIDRTWGDLCGIAIFGGDEDQRERAAQFAEKYFRAHISSRRCYDTQYAWNDKGTEGVVRKAAVVDGKYTRGAGPFILASRCGATEDITQARVIGLVYYPCAD